MSTPLVTSGAMLKCSFGAAPSAFLVPPTNRVTAGALPAGAVMDHIAMVNVPPFGMCSSPSNPEVIALTAKDLGVFTPAPCVPVLLAPWLPGAPTVTIGPTRLLALDTNCKLMCLWGGVIMVSQPAQMTVTAP